MTRRVQRSVRSISANPKDRKPPENGFQVASCLSKCLVAGKNQCHRKTRRPKEVSKGQKKKNYKKSLFPLTELAISNMIHNNRKGGILKNNIS